jgi:OOP family OmpA-OmpF porin
MTLKQTLIACATLTALAACSNSPAPTTGNLRNEGYLQDTAGNNAVVKALGYDACVRTGDWTPARATIECDPDLVPKPIAKAPAVAPPIAPAAPYVAPPAPPAKAVVQAPPPAPTPTPVPAPAPQRFTLAADAMFDFNKSTLRPGGRKKLDELADSLRGAQYDSIVATGHTDRIGSARYNQRLSERRAATVKKYLQSKGLDVGKISAIGKGKSQPVTKPADCPVGKMSRVALYACLLPDRRVEIEVSGSKMIDPNAPRVAISAEPQTDARTAAPRAKAKPATKAKTKARAKAKPLIGL